MPQTHRDDDARHSLLLNVTTASLAPLATLAIYLPSGLLMPFRIVSAVIVCIAGWSALNVRRADAPATRRTVLIGVTTFGFFGIVGALRFPNSFSPQEATLTLGVLVLALAISWLSLTKQSILFLLGGWFASSALCTIVAIWEILTKNHLPRNLANESSGPPASWGVVAAFFDNPNLYAYHCAVVLLILPVFSKLLNRWGRVVLWSFGFGVAVLLIWTAGRLALLGTLIGMLLWLVRTKRGRIAAACTTLLTLLIALVRPSLFNPLIAAVGNAIVEFDDKGSSSWVRAELIRSGWWAAEQSNFLGLGPGGFSHWALAPNNPFQYYQLDNAHWGVLEVLADYGIVSLIALLAMLVIASIAGLRWARKIKDPFGAAVAYATLVLAVTLPVLSASHSTWLRQPLTALHITTLVACAVYAERLRRKDREMVATDQPIQHPSATA